MCRRGMPKSRSLRAEPLEDRVLLATYSFPGTTANDTFDVVIGSVNHQIREKIKGSPITAAESRPRFRISGSHYNTGTERG